MATNKGRLVTLYVGTTNPGSGGTPTSKVGLAKDVNSDPNNEKVDATTNDSVDGAAEHEMVGSTRSETFKILLDYTNAAHQTLIAAEKNQTKVYVAVRPQGDGTSRPQDLFLASVAMKHGRPTKGLIECDVTFERSGPTDTTAQV